MASKTVADVMKMVKDNEVKFADFRFTDTRGKEQHVTVPVSHFDEDKFTSGHAFDGSSVAWPERSEEHTSELQSLRHLVCRLLLEKKKKKILSEKQVR